MKARESRSLTACKLIMAPTEDSAYWDYYYSQPPYGSPYWSVNMMAPVDRASRSQEPADDNSLGPGDLLESEQVVISLILPPQGLSLVALQTTNAGIGTYEPG